MNEILADFDKKRRALYAFIVYAQEMYTYDDRLASFKDANWPYEFPNKCTPENLAAAGFFYYPEGGSADTVFDFCSFKELDGWDENDDPWEEQMKRKKAHPLFSRRWAPKMDKFSCLRLASKDLTVHQVIKVGAACEEGCIQYRIDQLTEMHQVTREMLIATNNSEQAESADFSMSETIVDVFEARFKRWESSILDLIRRERISLQKLKKKNARRFTTKDINWTGFPDEAEWAAALDQPFIATKQRIDQAKADKENFAVGSSRMSNFVAATMDKSVRPPSSTKGTRSERSTRARRNNTSTNSIF